MARSRTSWPGRLALAVLVAGYLAIECLAGAPRSPLVPVLPPGVGVPSWTASGARILGMNGLGPVSSTGVALGIMAVLVVAFAVCATQAWRGRVGVTAGAAAVGASLVLVLAGPVLLSRDVSSYAAYGRMAATYASNPYRHVPAEFPGDPFARAVSAEWVHSRSVYGPLFTLASEAAVTAGGSSRTATMAWFKALAAVGVALAAWWAAAAARLLAGPGRSAAAAAFALCVVGLNPVLVIHTAGGGHNDALVAAGLAAAGLLAVRRGRVGSVPGGIDGWALAVTAVLTATTLIKVVGAIPLLMWWWALWREGPESRRPSLLLRHAAVAAILMVASAAPFVDGWGSVGAFASLASRQGWASGAAMVARGASALGRAVGGGAGGTVATRSVETLFLLGFAWVAWRVGRQASPRRAPMGWGVAMLAFALAAPYLLPWYAAWFLPPVALLGHGWSPGARGKPPLVVWIAAAVAATLALTGIPAEPGAGSALYHHMLLVVHYGAATVVLALFVLLLRAMVRVPGAGSEAPAVSTPATS